MEHLEFSFNFAKNAKLHISHIEDNMDSVE